jgi:COP9 signalosome complex subunit 1
MRGDLYLAPQAGALVAAIRRRALKQYLTPYVTVDLRVMAAAFGMAVEPLEDDIAELIVAGELSMRIDAHAKVLRAHAVDARAEALRVACETAADFVADAGRMLLRASLELDGGLVQGATKAARGGGGGGGGGGSGGGGSRVVDDFDAAMMENAVLQSIADQELQQQLAAGADAGGPPM